MNLCINYRYKYFLKYFKREAKTLKDSLVRLPWLELWGKVESTGSLKEDGGKFEEKKTNLDSVQ